MLLVSCYHGLLLCLYNGRDIPWLARQFYYGLAWHWRRLTNLKAIERELTVNLLTSYQ